MKRVLYAFVLSAGCIAASAVPARAGYENTIKNAVSLSVQGAAIQMERIGSSYSVTGSNLTVTGDIGLAKTSGTATAPAVLGAATFAAPATGAFSFTENLTIGDTVGTAITAPTAGVIGSPGNYGIYTTQMAGSSTSGSTTLGGTISNVGAMAITAGGVGTNATAQNSITLTVF